MLHVSLNCPFLIAPAIFPIVYLLVIKESYRADTVHAKYTKKFEDTIGALRRMTDNTMAKRKKDQQWSTNHYIENK